MHDVDVCLTRLLVVTTSEWAGPYIRDLVSELSKKNFEVIYVSLAGKLKTPLPRSSFIIDESSLFFASDSIQKKFIKLFFLVKKYSPKLIQTHFFHAGLLGTLVGRLMGIPVVLTRHHIDENFLSKRKLLFFVDILSAQISSHVIVTSNAAKLWLVKKERCKASKISVVNQGFTASNKRKSQKEKLALMKLLGFSPKNFNILCVCRYSPGKGQDFLLKSFDILRKQISDIHLTFIGHGDSTSLMKVVSERNLIDFVSVLEERDDIADCIYVADVIAHPSLVDSFSQLIIEAQILKRPIVAFDVAAANEQIIDGKSGFIVQPRDYVKMAEKLHLLFKDKQLRIIMGEYGFEHVTKKYTVDKMIEETVKVFDKVLN